MARKNTPPRGSAPLGPLKGPTSAPPGEGKPAPAPVRPTVQELAALEAMVAGERSRPRREPMETRREIRVEEATVPDIVAPEPSRATIPLRSERRSSREPGSVVEPLVLPRRGSNPPRAPRPPEPMMSEAPTLMDLPTFAQAPPRGALVRVSSQQEMVLVDETGAVPELPPSSVRVFPQQAGTTSDPRLLFRREPDSPRAAAFRVLRYRLEQLAVAEGGDPFRTTVLALCAPRAGQGATTAAANLALALSECDRARVCLIEGNLRRPALSALFGFKPPVCLLDRLQQDRDHPLSPWCVAELSPCLHVLSVRESAPRQPLVDGPAFGAAVEAMRRAGYRYVLVDGPEVLGIADMNLIEEVVDGVLLVAQGGVTTGSDLRAAAAQLSKKKLRGTVLLGAESA